MDKPEVQPLIAIQDEQFKQQYELGVAYALSENDQQCTPIPDNYLVVNLKYVAAGGHFASLDDQKLHRLGFCLGRYHGAILSTQTPALLTFSHDAAQKGYLCGRRAYFTELSEEERIYTDTETIEHFAQMMEENTHVLDGDDDALVYWLVGDFLGLLSGQLFPLIEAEQASWQ
jgi:hypothetical protein